MTATLETLLPALIAAGRARHLRCNELELCEHCGADAAMVVTFRWPLSAAARKVALVGAWQQTHLCTRCLRKVIAERHQNGVV